MDAPNPMEEICGTASLTEAIARMIFRLSEAESVALVVALLVIGLMSGWILLLRKDALERERRRLELDREQVAADRALAESLAVLREILQTPPRARR